MPLSSLIGNFEEHYTCFRLFFAESSSNPSEEVIHRLRVEMKHIITLLNFMEEHIPEAEYGQYYAVLKKISKKSGKIRDWQIIKRLFESHPLHSDNGIMEKIDAKIAKHQAKYTEFASSLSFEKNITDNLRIRELKVTPKIMDEYIQSLGYRANNYIISGLENREMWHKARHLLKRIYFLLVLKNELFDNPADGKQIQYYKDAEQLIGHWHDQTLINDFCEDWNLPTNKADIDLFIESEQKIAGLIHSHKELQVN